MLQCLDHVYVAVCEAAASPSEHDATPARSSLGISESESESITECYVIS
jgi:hypothetical protein